VIGVKQVLLRVPDDVHQRLTERAAAERRSVNALATEILDRGVDASAGSSERSRVVAKARRLGLLAEAPPGQPVDDPEGARAAALRASRGIGPLLDALLDEGR
jgi:plasmid stability protein